ncbi:MAG: hypothetical protein CMQ34_15315 [Gammaproteobacteria bacterium]|nr:hypothetical protein [Gammaproteobacteria bacterium]MBC55196.1 hypothetical protein [Gammaproteobacteria bacterium]|tara:strand:- start:2388 stop:3167 length:780 start_codon:yes stop_codon:yes gene_type:complete
MSAFFPANHSGAFPNPMLKKLAILTLLLTLVPILLVTTVLPPLTGLLIRPPLRQALENAQAFNIDVQDVRAGWFSTDIHFSAASSMFSADGLTSPTQHAILHVNHGPIMWHLYDTLFAVADIRLLPAYEQPGPGQTNFSGSGILRLDSRGQLHFDAITGFTAFAGDHWLEARARWPVNASWRGWRAVLRNMQLTLRIDANALALAQSPAAEALEVYRQQGWTRLSNGRAQTTIQLQEQLLSINGAEMPIGLFLDSPEIL